MAADYSYVVGYILGIVGQIVYILFGIGILAGTWYYLFIVKKRRYWLVDVYEQKSDGNLHLVSKDRLLEKKINLGRQTIYIFKKTKTESIPPPFECVRRLGGKEYCDYVRVLGEYIPLERNARGIPDLSDKDTKKKIFGLVERKIKSIREIPTNLFNSDAVHNKFCYIPLNKALKYDIEFKPISYDVNMMRINEIDSLDKIFEQRKDFWQKYGPMIAVGIMVAGVIVITYLSYQYSQAIVSQSLGAADKVAGPLSKIADKLGGNIPVT